MKEIIHKITIAQLDSTDISPLERKILLYILDSSKGPLTEIPEIIKEIGCIELSDFYLFRGIESNTDEQIRQAYYKVVFLIRSLQSKGFDEIRLK